MNVIFDSGPIGGFTQGFSNSGSTADGYGRVLLDFTPVPEPSSLVWRHRLAGVRPDTEIREEFGHLSA